MVMQSSKMPPWPRPNPPARKSGGNTKRPDKAIYIPKAARDRQRDIGGSLHDLPLPTLSCTSSGCTSPSESCCSCPCSSDTTEGTPLETPSTTNQDSVHSITSSAGQEDDFIRFSAVEPCPWPPAWDQTVSYFMAVTLEDQTEKEEGEVVEEVLTEEESVCSSNVAPHQHHASHTTPAKDAAGDAADFSQEITAHLTETDVAIKHAHNDYSCFGNVWINQDESAHVIEIHDFPDMFKKDDLLDAFADYSDGGMKIKWMDNTHALGVFSSQSAEHVISLGRMSWPVSDLEENELANQRSTCVNIFNDRSLHALSIRHPLLKTRTRSDSSKKAKGKVMRCAEFIHPVKERPQTDSAVARRMVTTALGLRRGGALSQHF